MNIRYVILLAIPILFSHCKDSNQELASVWILSNIENQKMSEAGKSIDPNFTKYMEEVTNNFLGFSYINLSADSTYTFRLGDIFAYGDWQYNTDTKIITQIATEKNNEVSKIHYQVLDQTDGHLKLKFSSEDASKNVLASAEPGFTSYLKDSDIVVEFEKDNFHYSDESENIYALDNNRWRIQPLHSENRAQIKDRLKRNIRYIALYLQDRITREEAAINLRSIISP
jgi:hypothetical protein